MDRKAHWSAVLGWEGGTWCLSTHWGSWDWELQRAFGFQETDVPCCALALPGFWLIGLSVQSDVAVLQRNGKAGFYHRQSWHQLQAIEALDFCLCTFAWSQPCSGTLSDQPVSLMQCNYNDRGDSLSPAMPTMGSEGEVRHILIIHLSTYQGQDKQPCLF